MGEPVVWKRSSQKECGCRHPQLVLSLMLLDLVCGQTSILYGAVRVVGHLLVELEEPEELEERACVGLRAKEARVLLRARVMISIS